MSARVKRYFERNVGFILDSGSFSRINPILVLLALATHRDFAIVADQVSFLKDLPGFEDAPVNEGTERLFNIMCRNYQRLHWNSKVRRFLNYKSKKNIKLLFDLLRREILRYCVRLDTIVGLNIVKDHTDFLAYLIGEKKKYIARTAGQISPPLFDEAAIIDQSFSQDPLTAANLKREWREHGDDLFQLYKTNGSESQIDNLNNLYLRLRAELSARFPAEKEAPYIFTLCEAAKKGKLVQKGANGPIHASTGTSILVAIVALMYPPFILLLAKYLLALIAGTAGYFSVKILIILTPILLAIYINKIISGYLTRRYDRIRQHYIAKLTDEVPAYHLLRESKGQQMDSLHRHRQAFPERIWKGLVYCLRGHPHHRSPASTTPLPAAAVATQNSGAASAAGGLDPFQRSSIRILSNP